MACLSWHASVELDASLSKSDAVLLATGRLSLLADALAQPLLTDELHSETERDRCTTLHCALRDEQKDEILTEWTSQTTTPPRQSDKDRRQGQTEESDKDRRERYKTLHCVMYRERTHTNGYVARESARALIIP